MKADNQIHYTHVRFDETDNIHDPRNGIRASGKGGLTIAFQQTSNGVKYAYSRCNQNDNFERTEGRKRAEGRLHSKKHNREIKIDVSNMNLRQVANQTIKEVATEIADQLHNRYGSFDEAIRQGQRQSVLLATYDPTSV